MKDPSSCPPPSASMSAGGRSGSGAAVARSFGLEVYRSFSRQAIKLVLFWGAVSGGVILLSFLFDIGPLYFLFFSSLASLLGTSLILFAGFLSGEKHIKAFHYIYALAFSDLIFTLKMFVSAAASLGGLSGAWKERQDAWCYTSTAVGQIGGLSAMGWNFAIIADLLFIVFNPNRYSANESRNFRLAHVLVWTVSFLSVVPALASGAVGLSPDQTCWMLGPYIWAFWGFWFVFVTFAVGSVFAIFWRLSRDGGDSEAYRSVQPFVKVVTQLLLITLVFFLNWVWNGALQMLIFFNQDGERAWLVAVQIFWLGGIGILDSWIWLPFIFNAIRRFRLIMEYRYMMSNIVGQRESGDTSVRPAAESPLTFSDLYTVNSGISRMQQSRLNFQTKSNQTPSQEMYSIDYDVDNVIDQLLAEQFVSRVGDINSTSFARPTAERASEMSVQSSGHGTATGGADNGESV